MKKILVIYFSQSGQLKQILDSVFSEVGTTEVQIDYKEIKPVEAYPFPWTSDSFFNEFPESVKGQPRPIEKVEVEGKYDLIVLGWQPWYLSPSQPITAFLQSPEARTILNGKNVLLIAGVRNMWTQAFQDLKNLLFPMGLNLVGNIVLEDRSGNLTGVRTVMKWALTGNKGPYEKLPEAGVSQQHIKEAKRFGAPIINALKNEDYHNLQPELEKLGAVEVKFPIFLVEKNGKKIFKIWSKFIQNKGDRNDKARLPRVRMFKKYLMFMIFILSPLPAFIFKMISVVFPQKTANIIRQYTSLEKPRQ